MNRRFFVIGDIEMGGGDIMDDFHDDDTLVRFIEHVGGVKADRVVMVLNGDVFDFLKMGYKGKYSRYITEDISLGKLDLILKAHSKVFEAWKRFLELQHTRLVFVIGNHDADVVWPKVQEKLREVLGRQTDGTGARDSKIVFTHSFDEEFFHAQHGNLIDPFFGFNHEKPIIEHKGKKILNLPFGSHVATQYLTSFKAKFHQQEVLYPQHEVFKKYPEYKKEINRLMHHKALKIFVSDPLLHLGDPMYRVPYGKIIKHVLRHGFDGVHDDRFLDIEELDTKFGKKSLYVLSHAHVKNDRKGKNARYIIVDCWRTELNVLTPDLQKKPKTYVEIEVDDQRLLSAEMKEFAL